MVGDNTIIKGRTPQQWRQLAEQTRRPHDTLEQLAEFIDWYHSNEMKDALTPANIRLTWRNNKERAALLLEEYRECGRLVERCTTMEQLQEVDGLLRAIEQRLQYLADMTRADKDLHFSRSAQQ